MKNEAPIKIGDFVKWYLMYNDVSIVKETGYGLVLGRNERMYGDFAYITYLVLRSQYNDKMHFENPYLEKV